MPNHNHFSTTLHLTVFFFYQPSSVRGWTSAFLLTVHRLCGVIEGRLSHFLPRWLRTDWQSADQPGKNPLKYSALAGNWTRPRRGQWAIPLSYHDWLSALDVCISTTMMQLMQIHTTNPDSLHSQNWLDCLNRSVCFVCFVNKTIHAKSQVARMSLVPKLKRNYHLFK